MTLAHALLLALMAGMSIPAGAVAASSRKLREWRLKHEFDSFVSYFGGGAPLAAIALVLVR